MNTQEYIRELLKGNDVAFEKPEPLSPIANFLWDKSVRAVKALPEPLKHEEFADKQLEKDINQLIDAFNMETAKQKEFYTQLFDDFLKSQS